MIFILIFAVVPLTEVYLFIEVGGAIGGWNTVLLAILTAILGVSLVKRQGLSLVLEMQKKVASDQAPLGELFDALCLLIAALLLITPGFFTDFIGFCLLVPPLRKLMRTMLFDSLLQKYTSTWFSMDTETLNSSTSSHTSEDDIIEGDFEIIGENNK